MSAEQEGLNIVPTDGSRPKLLGRPRAVSSDAKDALARSEAGHAAASGSALPLSALLDPTQPVVDIDGNRLTESIAWLYDAVQTLEERGNLLGAHLGRVEGTLQTTLQSWSASGPELDDGANSGSPSHGGGGTPAAAAAHGGGVAAEDNHDASSYPSTPAAQHGYPGGDIEQRIWRLEKDVRRMVRQQDRKRIAEEKLLEMRIDSLKCELDGRPSPSDLEGLKVHLAQKLEALESKTREDVGLLGSLLHQEGAADRRRLLAQFEAFQHRAEAQWELAESKLKAHMEQWDEELRRMQERLEALDAPAEGRVDGLDVRLAAIEERRKGVRSPASASGGVRSAGCSPGGADERAGVAVAGAAVEEDELPMDFDDLAQRLLNLEARVLGRSPAASRVASSPGGPNAAAEGHAGGMTGAWAPLGETEGSQSEVERRVGRLEAATFGPMGTVDSLTFSLTGAEELAGGEGAGEEGRPEGTAQGAPNFLAGLRQTQGEVLKQLKDFNDRLRLLEGYDDEGDEGQEYSEEVVGKPGEEGEEGAEGAESGDVSGVPTPSGGQRTPAKAASSPPRSPKGAGGRSPSEGGWRKVFEERISELEKARETQDKTLDKIERQDGHGKRSQTDVVNKLRRNIELLAKFVVGTNPGSSADAAAGGGVPTTDPLLWLERNKQSVRGASLEMRLRELEGSTNAGSGSGGGGETVSKRLSRMESSVSLMDVEYLQQIKPEMHDLRRSAEDFQSSLHREVSEVKVALGCLEACVPKETRKAVQLFKRAAGAQHEDRPVTPLTMQLEGKILLLQEELETRLKTAEASMAGHTERVTTVVRELERKQDTFRTQLVGVNEKLGLSPMAHSSFGSFDDKEGASSGLQVGVSWSPGAQGPASADGQRKPSKEKPRQTAPPGWAKAKP